MTFDSSKASQRFRLWEIGNDAEKLGLDGVSPYQVVVRAGFGDGNAHRAPVGTASLKKNGRHHSTRSTQTTKQNPLFLPPTGPVQLRPACFRDAPAIISTPVS